MTLELARTPDHAREALARNLRSSSADDRIRDHVRVVTGPQPYSHNHYSADRFFRFDPEAGTVLDVYGRRILRVTGNFLHALTAAVTREAGDEAGDVLFQIGFSWGSADMTSFVARIQQEYEVEFEKLGMGVMLESWWWPLRACGWGNWRYDFRHARNGMIFVNLFESAVAAALGRTERCACDLYAGLFASVFSHLARRELGGVEVRCASRGDDHCQFLIAAPKRTRAAAQLRGTVTDADELAKALLSVSTS